jgi:hypothetical protein
MSADGRTIVGGVPAKPIRRRFSGALVERPLAFAWWQDDVIAARGAGLAVDWTRPEQALDTLQDARDDGRLQPSDPKATARIRQT